MSSHAVCYTATDGYLFHTVFSAIQARLNSESSVGVYIVHLGDEKSAEVTTFQRVCEKNGVELVSVPLSIIEGLHPTYSRLFLDRILPPGVEEILYIDGDTQVVGDITPLLRALPPPGGALASRDPMVFIRQADKGLRRKIDGWWDGSSIPTDVRQNYINAGVLRMSRVDLEALRVNFVQNYRSRISRFHFADQDAINLALRGSIEIVSMSWNFPGFLLGTPLERIAPPRILHFMSNPRPWSAALQPWGSRYYEPYVKFVNEYPEVGGYWSRLTRWERAKYKFQQSYKFYTEGRSWRSSQAAEAVFSLESTNRRVE